MERDSADSLGIGPQEEELLESIYKGNFNLKETNLPPHPPLPSEGRVREG